MCDTIHPADPNAEKLLEHVRDYGHRIAFEMHPMSAVIVISQLQLAARHSGNRGLSAEIARRFLDDLIRVVADGDKEIEALLRRGDRPQFDVSFDVTAEATQEEKAGHGGQAESDG